jgi:16S rRNA C1402 N4-methylase RsmH
MNSPYHIPVMPGKHQGTESFPGAVVVDATYGGGGHPGSFLMK